MTTQPSTQKETTADGVSPGLRAWGSRSWLYLGIALWALAIISFVSALSGLVVPLTIAVIMAMLFYPLVDLLEARRVNRTIGSLLVLLLVVAILTGTAWVTWVGIFSQSEEMLTQIEAGLVALGDWASLKLPAGLAEQILVKVLEALPQLVSGITGFIFSGFSGIITFFFGGFTALFLLFYLLSDWHNVSAWVGRHLGLPEALGLTLVSDAAAAIRIYYYAVTLSALPVAVGVGLTMWLLGLPLAAPVVLITLVSSYIPYLGAILSAAFAALVALGAGGIGEAVVIVLVIVGLQNVVEPIISNQITSDKLEMHPIATLLATLSGGILLGALGATLASPVTAILIDAQKQIQAYQAEPQTDNDQNQQFDKAAS